MRSALQALRPFGRALCARLCEAFLTRVAPLKPVGFIQSRTLFLADPHVRLQQFEAWLLASPHPFLGEMSDEPQSGAEKHRAAWALATCSRIPLRGMRISCLGVLLTCMSTALLVGKMAWQISH